MDFTRQLVARRRRRLENIFRRIGEALQPFAYALDWFLATLFSGRLPADWRQQWHEFVADQATKGFFVAPQSVREIEDWIEAWARFCELLPIAESQAAVKRLGVGDARDGRQQPATPGHSQSTQIATVAAPADANPQAPRQNPRGTAPQPAERRLPAQHKLRDWPKLTPDEIDRIERNAGRRWWYPLVPSGETDWIWLSKLEAGARSARLALLTLYHELAALGRMAKEVSDSEDSDVEPLFAQQDKVQRAYDQYIQSLTALEITWKEYLQRVILVIGIHVIALKQKIDRALPSHVEGFHSDSDELFKNELRQSAEALQVARGRVERGYTALVWADRAVIAAQFALPIVGGAKQVFAAAVKQGLSKTAALKAAIAYAIPRAAIATAQGAAVGEMVPRILQGFGVDEAEARAGVTIFFSLLTLRGAIVESAGAGPSRKLNPATPTKRPPLKLPDAIQEHWVKWVEFEGVKVYQRDGLIDPRRLDTKGRTGLQRMNRGYAPIGPDGQPIELHHMLQTEEGALAEVTKTFHMEYSGTLHINPNTTPSGIGRPEFNAFRRQYWKRRAVDFTGGKS
jgi:hypothetical protein